MYLQLMFAMESETETSAAEEQLVRDMPLDDESCT